MSSRKSVLSLLTDAAQALQTAAELLQKEPHEHSNEVKIAELQAQVDAYKQKLSRPKGKGGKPMKKADFETLVKEKAAAPQPIPKQTEVQKQIHTAKGTSPQPEVFFGENDSLGSIMMRGAVKQEERREKAASKRRKF